MGRPSNDLLVSPMPNTSSPSVRGAASSASHTFSRPVSSVRSSWPLRNHVWMAAPATTAASPPTSAVLANTFLALADVVIIEISATASPPTSPSSAVRVWLISSRTSAGTAMTNTLVRDV